MESDLLTQRLLHPQNQTTFLAAVRAIRLFLLSAGLIYIFIILRDKLVTSTSYEIVLAIFGGCSSSPLYICLFINLVVILIVISSLRHNPKIDDGNTDEPVEDGSCGHSYEDYDLPGADLSPSAAPPPMQINRTPGKLGSEVETPASLKNQGPADDETYCSVKRVVDESLFADLSRLTRAREIKTAQEMSAGGKIRAREQGFGDMNVDEVTHDHYLPELGESREILGRADSQGSSDPVDKNIQAILMEETAGNQLEKEDREDEGDSMEETWRAIMQRKERQEKQLRKSETWPKAETFVVAEVDRRYKIDAEEDDSLPLPSSNSGKEMNKSMTFVRRDPSMSLEELNRRFDAFIQNFNREIRLQRQESQQRMINGAH